MTTIIIQGTQFETDKTIDVLKSTFPVIRKKASYTTDVGVTQIIDVSAEQTIDGFTVDETMQALWCCSNAVRDCVRCAYRKVSGCKERLQMDGAIVVNKILCKV